jgi:hypothetical protein
MQKIPMSFKNEEAGSASYKSNGSFRAVETNMFDMNSQASPAPA